ncbi:PASTA domain-containing protein [Gordonia sp. OPL2]|nr:PASTA domain-containing protein [Gordonia sp. OPL2]
MMVAGCSPAEETQSTTTVTETSTKAPPQTPATYALPTTTRPVPPPVETRTSASDSPAAPAALMPDVVCMNLQAAQNRIQDAGVFFSRSTDASGQGRSQILDSNWIVVAQTPDPGTPITEGDAVLSAVKIGEPSPC